MVGDAAAADIDDDEAAALPFESESEFVSELEPELELSLATLLLSPVSWTDQELGPPQVSKLYPLHFELHSESETLLLDAGSRSPHQQLDPMVVPITGLFWLTHCCWQYPGD